MLRSLLYYQKRIWYDTQAVTNVPGIVTAIADNGFYLQDPNPDNNPATSEGIFVFTGANRLNRLITEGLIIIGNSIKVSGNVTEFLSGGNTSNLTVTQISASANANTITKVSVGNPLPAAVLIGTEGRVPPTAIIAADNVPFEQTGIGFYESLEGMRVTAKDTVAVSPTSTFSNNSELWTVANRGANATGINSSGGITIAPGDFNPERIQIDDGFLRRNGLPYSLPLVNVGDFLGDVTGVSSYSFGNYEILVTEPPLSTSGGRQKEITPIVPTPERLTIASYNVENLNPFSGERFDVLAQQIISNLRTPDIIGLQEIQDNNGPINDGTVAADLTYKALIDSIKALGGTTYNYVNIDPEDGQDGGQPGSNIRVGYLYNPARVDLVKDSVKRITDEVGILDGEDAFTASRKPLLATFTFNGEEVTVINNHLTSRSGSNPLFGAIQPPVIRGEANRQAQTQLINAAVDEVLAEDANANVVVLGDLNGFEFERHLDILKGGNTPVLKNLNETLPERERYTFNFQGNSQSLDHVLVTNNLAGEAQYDMVRVNIDFVDQPADHEPLVASIFLPRQPQDFTLQIFHTSDQEAGVPAFSDIPGFSAVWNALDGKYANSLKLTSGDVYIASPFFNASRDLYNNVSNGRPADQPGIADILIQNELGWDVASVGNHEFTGGDTTFLSLLAPNANLTNGVGSGIGSGGYPGAKFPYLANNLDYSRANLPNGLRVVANGGTPLPNTLTGSVISEINGEKVGIIGIVTPYLKSIANTGLVQVTTLDANGNEITGTSPIGVQVDSIIANVTPEVQALTNAGINKIILMTHLQESAIEQALAQKLADSALPVDILLGGGSHQLMATEGGLPLREDETQQNSGQLLRPFPQEFISGDNKVLFVNSAPNYRYLNQLVVTFDPNGVIKDIGDDSGAYATDIAGVDRLYTENITNLTEVKAKADPEIVAIVEGVRGFVNNLDGTIFGQTEVFLNGIRGDVRTQETNLGNLAADSQDFYAEAYLKKHNPLNGLQKIDISFQNGGTIRDFIGQSLVETLGSSELRKLPPAANPEVGKEEGDISQLDIANSLRFDSPLVVGTVTATGFLALAEHMISSVETGNGRFGQIGGFNFSFNPSAPAQSRIENLALADNTGKSVEAIVKDGELVVDPNRVFSVVTSRFLADGGDSYPTVIQNLVDLNTLAEPDSLGNADLASGQQQDALAEYLQAFFNSEKGQAPFFAPDTPQSGDKRIQNLNFRNDTVLDGITPPVTPLPPVVNGTPGDDLFDAAIPDARRFAGDNQILFTSGGNDTVDVSLAIGGNRIDTGSGDDLIFAGTNNRIIAGSGSDRLFLGNGGGNNVITGGSGAEQFWLVTDDVDLPVAPNIITDFNRASGDVLGFAGTSLSFGSIQLRQVGPDTFINALDHDLAKLLNIQASSLNASAFVFG